MRLVNYGAGEISDRLTILALKILHGTVGGKDVQHFKTEQTALLQQIRARTLNGKWFDAVLDLAAVNGALWQAEDDLRQWRTELAISTAQHSDAIVELAFRIQYLNDQRAALVQQINKDAGDALGQEKL